MNQNKQLYRSKTDRMLLGVCGGLGEYLGTDATIIRLIWAALTVISGFIPFIVIYLVAALIIPEKQELPPSNLPPSTNQPSSPPPTATQV